MGKWSEWRPFPDPRAGGYLVAPVGPGVYQLRSRSSGALLLAGHGKCCALRMSSLLPAPLGQGTRKNGGKRAVVLECLPDIEYRTIACGTKVEAAALEHDLLDQSHHRFPT